MKQKLITEYFKENKENKKRKISKITTSATITTSAISEKSVASNIIKGYNQNTDSWHCIECGIDMGSCNPRQLCGKTFCYSYEKILL